MTWQGGFSNPTVGPAQIQDGSITSTKLADGSVLEAKLADLAVAAGKLQDEAVTTAKIGASAVTTVKINDAAITTAKIGLLAVGTAQIANAAITNAKINDLSADKINAGSITALLFRTASSGERLEIDGASGNSFIELYNSGGTLAGQIGYEPTGYGADIMALTNELNLGKIRLDAGGIIELFAGGSAGEGVRIESDASGGIPGNILVVSDETRDSYQFTTTQGLKIFGVNPYTTAQAWLTLNSPSSGGNYDDQAAGISIGESGYKGNAAMHIYYTGNGYGHIGMGTYTDGNEDAARPKISMVYNADSIYFHPQGTQGAPGWAFANDTDTGIARVSTNYFGIAAGGKWVGLFYGNGSASASVFAIPDGLTDVGNHETLRLNRGTGSTNQFVGYYSSWLNDPEDGHRRKHRVVPLKSRQAKQGQWWQREWFLDLEPIKYERVRGQKAPTDFGKNRPVELGFYIENLIKHTNLLTTKGSEVGGTPDEYALLAVTVDYVQHLEERVAMLEKAIAA